MRASAPASSSSATASQALAGQRVGGVEPGPAAVGQPEGAPCAGPRLRQPLREGQADDRAELIRARLANALAQRPRQLAAYPLRLAAAQFGQPAGEIGIAAIGVARAQECRHRERRRRHAVRSGGQQHVGEPRMQRQLGHRPPVRRDRALGVEGPQLAAAVRARCANGPAGGWVGKRSAAGSRTPQAASSSASGARSASSISAGRWAGRPRSSSTDHSRRHRPGPSRPARPLRCSAEARLIGTVTSRLIPVRAEKRCAPLQPAVDHRRDALDGQAGLGDVGREHDPTRAPGRIAASCAARGRSP